MWKCYWCDAEFDEPGNHHYREDMNGEGAWQDFFVKICPYCGSEEIEEVSDDEVD